jgi:hypothetical protein
MLNLDQALETILSYVSIPDVEECPFLKCMGLKPGKDVYAIESLLIIRAKLELR